MLTRRTLFKALTATVLTCGPALAQIDVYVDKNTTALPQNQDGTSWATAFSDLSSTVCQYDLDEVHDVIIHVAEGIYSPSNGETFPIVMRQGLRIWGENAFTVVLDGEGSERGVVFSTDPTQVTVTDPCTGANAAIPGSFTDIDGTYLANLTVRDFNNGLELYGVFNTGGSFTSPALVNLVLRGNRDTTALDGSGIMMETAAPRVYDCTIYDNDFGIRKVVKDVGPFGGGDCSIIDVVNCIVRGNQQYDLSNVSFFEIGHSNFSRKEWSDEGDQCGTVLANSRPWTPGVGISPGTGAPRSAENFNVDRDPGFVFGPNGFDLRLASEDLNGWTTPGVRNIGFDTTGLRTAPDVSTDGEGYGNPRVLPYPNGQPTNLLEDLQSTITDISMGADQYDMLMLYPLDEFFHPNGVDRVVGVRTSGAWQANLRFDGEPGRSVSLYYQIVAPAYPSTGWQPIPIPATSIGSGWWYTLLIPVTPPLGLTRSGSPPVPLRATNMVAFVPNRWTLQAINFASPITVYELTNAQDYVVIP